MTKTPFPLWFFIAVALAIAIVAFALGQLWGGSGGLFTIVATTLWTIHAARRGRMVVK